MKNTKYIFLDSEEVPEEVEHEIIKDSILEIASANFSVVDQVEEVPVGEIRRAVSVVECDGKPVTRKNFESKNWIEKGNSLQHGEMEFSSENYDSDESEVGQSGSEVEEEYASEGMEVDDGSIVGGDTGDDLVEEYKNSITDESNKSDTSGDDEEDQKKEIFEGINIFSDKVKDVNSDFKKGKSIKNQLLILENIIEYRIKFQKAMQSCNNFYQVNKCKEFISSLNPKETTLITSTNLKFRELLDTAIKLDDLLLKNSGDYHNFKKGISSNSSAEEITSSDEEEEKGNTKSKQPIKKKRITLKDYGEYLREVDADLKPWRDAVIQKWNDKTRLAAGKGGISKFAILEQSMLKQIEQILIDKDRLVKRTQIKRSKDKILGKPVPVPGGEKEIQIPDHHDKSQHTEEYDPEIFDDDDFYHKILKDFIDRKTFDVSDPSQLGRQWTKLQNLRNKMKRTVDTRATKGRRLRYTVHQRLVNFMAPVNYTIIEDHVEKDLFNSLFGQAATALPTKCS